MKGEREREREKEFFFVLKKNVQAKPIECKMKNKNLDRALSELSYPILSTALERSPQ